VFEYHLKMARTLYCGDDKGKIYATGLVHQDAARTRNGRIEPLSIRRASAIGNSPSAIPAPFRRRPRVFPEIIGFKGPVSRARVDQVCLGVNFAGPGGALGKKKEGRFFSFVQSGLGLSKFV